MVLSKNISYEISFSKIISYKIILNSEFQLKNIFSSNKSKLFQTTNFIVRKKLRFLCPAFPYKHVLKLTFLYLKFFLKNNNKNEKGY